MRGATMRMTPSSMSRIKLTSRHALDGVRGQPLNP